MLIDILMPALSPTMIDGRLARWLKRPGDAIAPGDVIVEIETDKSLMEVEAVDAGTLHEIIVPDGTDGVAVSSVIATLLAPTSSQVQSTPREAVEALTVQSVAGMSPLDRAGQAMGPIPDARTISSPLARNLAKRSGLDIAAIKGSGPLGRVIKADVDDALSQSPSPRPAHQRSTAHEASRRADLLGMNYELQINSTVRKAIARRLSEAKRTIPHFYLNIDCHVDALLKSRARHNELQDGSVNKITINDCVIRAAALALRKFPDINASWEEEAMLIYRDVDIAVAVDSPLGLITPIIRQADNKSLRQISKEMHDLAQLARSGGLSPHDYNGGTFSISNLGMVGISSFSAIINPPHSCILAIGRGEQRPVVSNGQVVIATVMTCTLSADHRVVDGARAAAFLRSFQELIEHPQNLMPEDTDHGG